MDQEDIDLLIDDIVEIYGEDICKEFPAILEVAISALNRWQELYPDLSPFVFGDLLVNLGCVSVNRQASIEDLSRFQEAMARAYLRNRDRINETLHDRRAEQVDHWTTRFLPAFKNGRIVPFRGKRAPFVGKSR